MREAARLVALALCSGCSFSVDATGAAPDAPPGSRTDAASTGDATVEATCGTRTGMRGTTTRMVSAGGMDRTFHVYLPAGDPTAPMPLVFVHHGYTMSAQDMLDKTRFTALADQEHIALAFPDGQGGPSSLSAPWNVGDDVCWSSGGPPPNADGDDLAMLDAIEAEIATDQCIDTQHVYATGFSMGGYFSNHVACASPKIRSAVPHSGGSHELTSCAGGPKPMLIMHGLADPIIPSLCGREAAERWATHNGCATTTTDRDVDGGTCHRYDGCPAGGQVEYCSFDWMGHCWAGGESGAIYTCPSYENATALAWQFWKTYAY